MKSGTYLSLVTELQFGLRLKGNALQTQFPLKTFLINRLQKATPFFFIYFKAGPKDSVGLFLIE